MNNFICICGLLLVGLLASQAPSPKLSNSEADTSSGHRAGAKAHEKAERANRNVRPTILRGSASWYGRQFEGKKTASGTTFHADGHTAAAEGIPLGSTVKVTNVENGRSARVKVTDRGPKVPGRVVDVSRGTAEQLGMTEKGCYTGKGHGSGTATPEDGGGHFGIGQDRDGYQSEAGQSATVANEVAGITPASRGASGAKLRSIRCRQAAARDGEDPTPGSPRLPPTATMSIRELLQLGPAIVAALDAAIRMAPSGRRRPFLGSPFVILPSRLRVRESRSSYYKIPVHLCCLVSVISGTWTNPQYH